MKNGLPNKIVEALKSGRFGDPQEIVLVDETPGGFHVLVISRQFEGLLMKERIGLITTILNKKLTKKEKVQVTLVTGATPSQVIAAV